MSDGLRPPGIGRARPDGSLGIVGNDGRVFSQDFERLVVRPGARGADADWSVSTDLTAEPVIIEPENIGGTTEISGAFESAEERTFSIAVRWAVPPDLTSDVQSDPLPEDELEFVDEPIPDGVLYEQRPTPAQNTTSVELQSIVVKGDNVRVLIEDVSDAPSNIVRGTLNIH